MTNIVDCVRRNVNEWCVEMDEIRKGDRSVSLGNPLQSCSATDLDDENALAHRNRQRCDYSFIASADENWVIPIELKATGLNPNKVTKQLSAGVAAKIVPRRINSKFVPVAVVEAASKKQLEALRDPDAMIRFRGLKEYIRVIYCGDLLTDAM